MSAPKMGLTVESRERHERFLKRAVAGGAVWSLLIPPEGGGGWVHSTANGDETGKGYGKRICPLWSDKAHARQCAKNAWSKCVPYEIPLEQFLSEILPNMQKAKVLVGTNWNAHLIGHEIAPKQLLSQLKAELAKESEG